MRLETISIWRCSSFLLILSSASIARNLLCKLAQYWPYILLLLGDRDVLVASFLVHDVAISPSGGRWLLTWLPLGNAGRLDGVCGTFLFHFGTDAADSLGLCLHYVAEKVVIGAVLLLVARIRCCFVRLLNRVHSLIGFGANSSMFSHYIENVLSFSTCLLCRDPALYFFFSISFCVRFSFHFLLKILIWPLENVLHIDTPFLVALGRRRLLVDAEPSWNLHALPIKRIKALLFWIRLSKRFWLNLTHFEIWLLIKLRSLDGYYFVNSFIIN